MLGLLGFYDEFDDHASQPNGSLRDAVRPLWVGLTALWQLKLKSVR